MAYQGPKLLLEEIKSDRVKAEKHLELGLETISASGAASVVLPVSFILAAATAVTLADGKYPGQIKVLICKTFSSTITVTPADGSSGLSTIVFSAVNDSWIGIWYAGYWWTIAMNGVTFT